MSMNFEQLLEGANDPNPFKAAMIWGLAQNRLSPDVMREAWAALAVSKRRFELLGSRLGADIEVNGVSVRAAIADIDRAIALLDGQTEDKL